jgi:hypothetical protein
MRTEVHMISQRARCFNASVNVQREYLRAYCAIVSVRRGKFTSPIGTNGMTSNLDEYFTNNYNLLVSIARGIIYRCGRKYEPETVVSNAYVFMRESYTHLESHLDMQKMAIHFIKTTIERNGSQMNYQHRKAVELVFTDTYHDVPQDEDDRELYNAIDDYMANEQNLINRIVAEVYIDKGIRTVRDFAAHFKISTKAAREYIDNLKLGICKELDLKRNTKD